MSHEPNGEPRVSVVIPCYNQGHFLAEALDSALGQTAPPFEVVVVDDGSTDETSEVVARYPEVRGVRQGNEGLAAARNAGLAASRGELILFLDADDRLLPDALAVHLEQLAAHPQCAVVAGRHLTLHTDGSSSDASKWRGRRTLAPHEAYEATLVDVYHLGAAMFRRKALEAVGGFDTRFRVCEDHDLELRVARRFDLHWHDEMVAEYRRHQGNMSNDIDAMWLGCLAVYRAQWGHISGNDRWRDVCRLAVRWRDHGYARKLLARARAEGGPDARPVLLRRYHARYPSPTSELGRCIWELAVARLAADDGDEVSPGALRATGEDDDFTRLVLEVHAELLAASTIRAGSIRAVRRLAEECRSDDAVAVISRGDTGLVEQTGRRLVHFPGTEDGSWAGYYPASSDEAVASLRAARRRGVTALVVPRTSRWWLSYYGGFAVHLQSIATEVVEASDGSQAFRFPALPHVASTSRRPAPCRSATT